MQRPKARGGSQAAYTSNRLVHNPLFHHLSNKINLFQSQLLNRTSHLPTKIAADTVNILRYPYPAHQPNTKKSRTIPPPNHPFFPLQYQATLSPLPQPSFAPSPQPSHLSPQPLQQPLILRLNLLRYPSLRITTVLPTYTLASSR